ncbi:uncharacterized protein [Anabrus simplex]|uniref:uncharacterized protein n=1 Tax=Anabrus simplex TaxID=316456 RepID=UPI0035A2B251
MTAGQCCVLLARSAAEGCGLKGTPVARCLFGPPDPAETRKLMEEEFAINRERMLRRWGMDILTLEQPTTPPSPAVVRPTPYSRQTRISDFWRNKRASNSVRSSSGLKTTTDRTASNTNSSSSISKSPSELQQS